MRQNLCVLAGLSLGLSFSLSAAAADASDAAPEGFTQALSRGFYSRFNVLGFGVYQDPKDSRLNPDNALDIPRYQAEVQVRPDFNLSLDRFEFGLKPRFRYAWSRVADGVHDGSDSIDHRFYVNEGYARYRITDTLLANVGRENLQWGPSSLLSPSNPFNPSNGKNNPNIEVAGLDYARVVWIPSSSWTVSTIANTGPGRLRDERRPFEKTYAVKLDYTGDNRYVSLLSSYRESDGYRHGFFGGWNASDALLLYAEGSISNEKHTASGRDDYEVLLGGSYTLESGPTLTLEYFHNNNGCDRTRIDLCYALNEVDPRDPLVRRDYVLLQYVDTKIRNNLNLTLRLTHNIDDSSSQFIANFEYEVGAHWQLYFIPTALIGNRDSEFGSLARYSIFVGAGYTF